MNAEQQLHAIRERWRGRGLVIDDRAQDDVDALLRLIDERDAIIHDLQLDGAGSHERIRQAERREVIDCLRHLLQRKRRQKKAVDLYDIETQIIGCRGIVGNLLPPDQARQERERLRAKLRDIGEMASLIVAFEDRLPGLINQAAQTIRQITSEFALTASK